MKKNTINIFFLNSKCIQTFLDSILKINILSILKLEFGHLSYYQSCLCQQYSGALASALSFRWQAFGTKLTLPANFASRGAEELNRADFYEKLQKVRDGYDYRLALHHQQEDGEASDALKKAKLVLVRQDEHKPPLVEAYRGPYKIKLGN